VDSNWLWLVPVVGFFVLEFWGLHSSTDRQQPLTYWLRKGFGLKDGWHSIGWWLAAGILGWLVVHFLIASTG
jgi:hypothetical protein